MLFAMTLKQLYRPIPIGTVLVCLFIGLFSSTADAQTAGTQTPDTDPQQQILKVLKSPGFNKAMKAYRQQDLTKAKKHLTILLTRFPNNPIVLNNLAVIANQQNQHALAIQYLKRAMASDKIIYVNYQNLSIIYAYQASQAYRRALALSVEGTKPPQLEMIESAQLPEPKVPEIAQQLLKEQDLDRVLVEDPLVLGTEDKPQKKPPPVKIPTRSSNIKKVKTHILSWAQAWSKQDLAAYLASYAPFYAPDGLTHRQWKAMRAQRILAPRKIEVVIKDLKIQEHNSKSVTAVFQQQYRSNLLKSNVTKQLTLIKLKEGWKITGEEVLR